MVNEGTPGWNRLRRRLFPGWAFIGLVAGILAAILRDAAVAMRYSAAVGIDGYYYVIQIAELTAHHHFYFPTKTPLILYFLAALNVFTHDPVWAVKFGSVILDTVLCLGVFAVITSATRKMWLGVLGIALLVIPRSRFYLPTEYINQLGAIVLLLWTGWSATRAAQSRSKNSWLIPGVLVVAAFFSHRSALVLVAAIAVCVLLMFALGRGAKWRIVALLASLILLLVPAMISVQPFFIVPDWLQSQISLQPRWPMESILFAEELMLMISALMTLCLVVWQSQKSKMNIFGSVFGSIALFSLLVTLNPFMRSEAILSSLAGRLRVLSYIQVALLVPALIWLVYSIRREAALYVAAIFLPLFILSAFAPLPHGVRPEFLDRRTALMQGLIPHLNKLGSKPMVIAPHGDQFVVTATLGVASQQQPPQNPDFDKVYWLLNDADPTLSSDAIVLFRNSSTGAILIEDSVFRRRWETMTALERDQLLRTNPQLARILKVTHGDSGLD